ncbi:MAG: FeoB-associated Cys-rich membrane protein [Clostridiales bacterium]|nr:FeoB-associated Cys-rich membrane protein [Clostridiales bacterium]
MNYVDYAAIAIILLLIYFAFKKIRKKKGCGECSSCPYHNGCEKKEKDQK